MARSWTSTFNVDGLRTASHAGVTEGLTDAAALIFADSQRRVPFEKGDLSRSGDSGLVSDTRAAVTYTDRGAVDAHERTDVPAGNGRERKYLENAMNSQSSKAAAAIAAAVRGKLGT